MKRAHPVQRVCLAPGCGRVISPHYHFCGPCWRRLPGADRAAIAAARLAKDWARTFRLSSAAAAALPRIAAETARRIGERNE